MMMIALILSLWIWYVQGSTCGGDKLTVYKVVLQTNWDPKIFPKQYPQWRPPAQWSKLIGRTHNSSYGLFHEDKTATEGMKEFTETGATNVLEEESQGVGGIFDEFNSPPITEGIGKSESEFFVDSSHAMVSMAARMVPSPDWFIGIDSFNLCNNGNWIDAVLLEVTPMDAGTDNGFTFTSPNWPTKPRKPIAKITSQFPDHPANSFFYPERLQHPSIATFSLIKVREYELARVFEPKTPTPPPLFVPTESHLTDGSTSFKTSNNILPIDEYSPRYSSQQRSKQAIINSLVRKYKKKYRKNHKGKKHSRRNKAPRHCRVSEWSDWSSCSKTCGIGEQIRKRKVLKQPRRGGRACPLLLERKWCGSSRDCDKKYFDW